MTSNLLADLLVGNHGIVEVYLTILILQFPLLDSKMYKTPIFFSQILPQVPPLELGLVLRFAAQHMHQHSVLA